MWISQFRAMCAVKGVSECFDPNWKNTLPATEHVTLSESDATEKKHIKAKKKNTLAFSFATLAMDTPRLLVLLEGAKSADWQAEGQIFFANGWTIPFLTPLPITPPGLPKVLQDAARAAFYRLHRRPTLRYGERSCC